MNRYFLAICIGLIIFPGLLLLADDLTFDSFEAAEAAAQKRAQEYQKKMDEHMQNISKEWEESQKDIGKDSSYPDITKITSKSDGQKSSDNEASKGMENAVNSSVNQLKDQMINSAGPNSTGFAGGGAGYQWKVKFVNGKYVLSDSYNEADFNTGKGKDTPSPSDVADNPAGNDGAGKDDTAATKSGEDSPSSDATAAKPDTGTSGSTSDPSGSSSSSSSPGSSPSGGDSVAKAPGTTDDCADGMCDVPTGDTPGAKADPAKPSTPGFDAAPPSLPPPAVKLVIQNPTDFSEEVFSANADSESSEDHNLERFKIPEDTRIKIAVELADDINPDDVSLVITDDEGTGEHVSSGKLRNYRHMFRVPDDSKYSAAVYINDKSRPGNYKKKLMQVKIPVSKVDFESRAIDNQRGKRGGNAGSSSASSGSTSSSAGAAGSGSSSNSNDYSGTQQVDLSDFYSSGDSSSSGNSSSSGSGDYDSDNSSSEYGATSGSSGSSGYQSNNESGSYSGGTNGDSGSSTGSGNSDESGASGQAGNRQRTSRGQSGASSSSSDRNSGAGSYSGDSSAGESEYATDASSDGVNSSGGGSYSGSDNSGSSASNYGGSASYGGSDDEVAGYNGGQSEQENNSEVTEGSYQNSNNNSGYQMASAKYGNVQSSSQSAAADGKTPDLTVNEEVPVTEDDPFVVALSIKSEKNKIYQSFDFIDQPTQISTAVPAGSEIIFSINYSKLVDPDSITITLSDGQQKFDGNLKSMGESFAYVFPEPTQHSFIHLRGKASGKTFNYRLSMPVSR